MTTTLNDKHTVMPPTDLEEMLDLSRFLGGLTQPAALLGPDGQTVPLPLEAFNVLRDVVEAMRVGKAITVAPVDQMLTTDGAATVAPMLLIRGALRNGRKTLAGALAHRLESEVFSGLLMVAAALAALAAMDTPKGGGE